MTLNDGKYGYEVEEYGIDLTLNDPEHFLIVDRIWMQKNMSFPTIDLQKHMKTNHFKRSIA